MVQLDPRPPKRPKRSNLVTDKENEILNRLTKQFWASLEYETNEESYRRALIRLGFDRLSD